MATTHNVEAQPEVSSANTTVKEAAKSSAGTGVPIGDIEPSWAWCDEPGSIIVVADGDRLYG